MIDERAAIDMEGVLSDLTFPDVGDGSLVVDMGNIQSKSQPKDLFAVKKRSSWNKTNEARCDFTYKLSLTRRSDVNFVSIWKKSVYGRTLTDIKNDPAMVEFFVESITPVISETLGYHLASGGWCICTSPKRRHLTKNFATLISERIGAELGIPFYEDVALCHSKQRVNAVFEAKNIPSEPNVIVFDDFVTTGMTLAGMKKLLSSLKKNVVFYSCINNKL